MQFMNEGAMNIINPALVIAVIFAAGLTLWWVRRHSQLQGNSAVNAQLAIRACHRLLELIAAIQQHRGMV